MVLKLIVLEINKQYINLLFILFNDVKGLQ